MQNFIPEDYVEKIIKECFNAQHYRAKDFFVETQMETRKRKKADVLFAFKRRHNQIYTSVVEAKSKNMLSDLKPQLSFRKQIIISRFILIILSTFAFTVLGIQLRVTINGYSILIVISLVVAMITLISLILVKTNSKLALTIPVLEQLHKYPANEKWVAIGKGTFSKHEDYITLLRYCKKAGVGLLVVDEMDNIIKESWSVPKHESNNYIDKYKKADTIKSYFKGSSYTYRTPAEKRKIKVQVTNSTLRL